MSAFVVATGTARADEAASTDDGPQEDAAADPRARADPPRARWAVPEQDWELALYLGGCGFKQKGPSGLALGGSGAYRFMNVLAELHGDIGGFLGTFATLGASTGVVVPTPYGVRLELLGGAGVRSYRGWGKSLLGDDPGASAVLPHAAATMRLGFVLPSSRRDRFELGVVASFEHDLAHESATYSYEELSWLSGESSTRTQTTVIGGDRVLVALILGATVAE